MLLILFVFFFYYLAKSILDQIIINWVNKTQDGAVMQWKFSVAGKLFVLHFTNHQKMGAVVRLLEFKNTPNE
jgi:hypothetical protein